MKNFYVYYSYEEWGRGYIGARGCNCSPEEDFAYLGSFYDKTFHPTEKVILGVFDNMEDALKTEVELHSFFKVDKNPHFANQSLQTSHKFVYAPSGEIWITNDSEERRVPEGSKIPEGFRLGRLLEKRRWYNNGCEDLWLSDGEIPPEGFTEGRLRMTGKNNPQYGTKWITDGHTNAKITEEETLPEGWKFGFTPTQISKIWINNGKESRQHPLQHPLPKGWHKGRIMPWASAAAKKSHSTK